MAPAEGPLFVDRQWLEKRRELVETRIRALDFFGAALEKKPSRDRFWPAIEGLGEIVLALRQSILACMDASDAHDIEHPSPLRNLQTAQRHADEAALQLYMLAEDESIRQWIGEQVLQTLRLDELHPDRLPADRSCGPDGLWDELLSAYDTVFEQIRLANIAYRTDEMDQ